MSPKAQNWKKQRKSGLYDKIEYRCYIFCEGEKTEPLYFSSFKKYIEKNAIYKNAIYIQIEGTGMETLRIIDAAQNYINKNSIKKAHIWCVYDKDSFPPNDFNGVAKCAESLNSGQKSLKYKTAWSNQCIEYWFVLHFAYYDSDNDRKYYWKFLDEKFLSFRLEKYKKNSEDIFDILLKHGNPKLAIQHAKKRLADCDGKSCAQSVPATMVYALVEELARYLPEDMRSKFL